MNPSPLSASSLPPVIQGGMGVGVSGWRLARAVSLTGQLGVVSGTMLDVVCIRQLQLGDDGGHLRRALAHFPDAELAQRVLDRYFIEGGKPAETPFKTIPMMACPPTRASLELAMLAAYAFIWLAKEGHDGKTGLNLLEKSQLPSMPSLFGAMLAGVDVILMGAGIPRQIPGILDRFAAGEPAELRLDVTGATDPVRISFDPSPYHQGPLKRPLFLAIVSSPVLAENLRRKASGTIDGFVVEASIAGGHNAPPRGSLQLDENREPIYGPRDRVDVGKFREIGLPFWLAGGFASSDKLREARDAGAMGIQVGTAFALSDESGFDPALKSQLIESIRRDELKVFTDVAASPTGFPFKTALVPGTLADRSVYDDRHRTCDIGVLRELYLKDDGTVGFRCSAEPAQNYLDKGGNPERLKGAMCLCNSLGASIGLGQQRVDGTTEAPLITLGDDIDSIRRLLPPGGGGYPASKVIEHLLAPADAMVTA